MLRRGDQVSIDQGSIVITPASKKIVPLSWMLENQDQIIKELSIMFSIDLLVYVDYSTGCYGDKRHPGVSLQFQWITSLSDAYVIFNAELKRARTTKSGQKGSPLPKKHFIAGRKSKFLKFWARTGLKLPPRLSSFHDYMGNLKKLVFVADCVDSEKLDKDSLKPFYLSTSEVSNRFLELTDNIQTSCEQNTDNIHTTYPDKESSESLNITGSEKVLTAGNSNYGIRSSGNADIRDNIILFKEGKKHPSEQTNEEWLADYSKDDLC